MSALNHCCSSKRLTQIVLLLLCAIACSKNSTKAGSYTNPENPQSYTPSVEVIDGDCPADTVLCKNGNWCCPAEAVCVINTDNALGCGNDYCCLACEEELPCGLGCCPVGLQCVVNPGEDSPCDTALCCESGGESSTCPSDIAAQCPDGTYCVVNSSASICPDKYNCRTPSGDIGCPGEILCPDGHDFCPAALACQEKGSQACRVYSVNQTYCCGEATNPDICPEKTCGEGCCPEETACVKNPGSSPTCQKANCCLNYDVDAGVNDGGHVNPGPKDAGGADAEITDAGICPNVYAPSFTVECPNGIDCCLTDTYCGFQQGVCLYGSFGGNYCCMDNCPPDISAQCPADTQCRRNSSSRTECGEYACYFGDPYWPPMCPGEIRCGDSFDFCPKDKPCHDLEYPCPDLTSHNNMYCCGNDCAKPGRSCDNRGCCDEGANCISNPGCDWVEDYGAGKVCYGPCGNLPDCGNGCCPLDHPICGGTCVCLN